MHLTRRDLPQLALLVLAGFVINQLLEYAGLSLSTAADVALLITSESIGIALVLGTVGMYLIVEQGLIPHLPGGGGTLRILGDLLVIAGLISESFYTVHGKALFTKYPPFLITTAALIGSLVLWGSTDWSERLSHFETVMRMWAENSSVSVVHLTHSERIYPYYFGFRSLDYTISLMTAVVTFNGINESLPEHLVYLIIPNP